MKIGIVGSGNMGRSLGVLLSLHGHHVYFGARRPEQRQAALALAAPDAQAGSNQEAADFGDVVVWAVRGVPATAVVPSLSVLVGKPVIDLNNHPRHTGGSPTITPQSAAEKLQQELSGALVVKAFNTLPMEIFEVPEDILRQHSVTVFLTSDDLSAKTTVSTLASQLGFTPVDFGPLQESAKVEYLGDLVRHALSRGASFLTTFSLVTLPTPLEQRLGGRRPSLLP